MNLIASAEFEAQPTGCPKCDVLPGFLHHPGCFLEPCPACGRQAVTCICSDEEIAAYPRIRWTGRWPGVLECTEFGWFAVPGPDNRGWASCPPGTPNSVEDINRLYTEATWDPAAGRFVRRPPAIIPATDRPTPGDR